MNIPNDVCYTKSHEWVKFAEDGSATAVSYTHLTLPTT